MKKNIRKCVCLKIVKLMAVFMNGLLEYVISIQTNIVIQFGLQTMVKCYHLYLHSMYIANIVRQFCHQTMAKWCFHHESLQIQQCHP